MKKIPVILVDEHHEAFVAWHILRERGIVPPTGNYLLHIDHHDDMECGGYDWDFTHSPLSVAEAKVFQEEALGIADFIIPAVYFGLFDSVHILKNLVPTPLACQERFIFRKNRSQLHCGNYIPFIHASKKGDKDSGYCFFSRIDGGLGEKDSYPDHLVLDVDLDYFCWDDSLDSAGEKKLEITAAAYEELQADKNHPFHLFPRKLIKAARQGEKYYLVYREHLSPPPLPDEETIARRIRHLMAYLEASGVRPSAIDICRSSYSGYLPRSRAAFVEREFLAGLARVWKLEIL